MLSLDNPIAENKAKGLYDSAPFSCLQTLATELNSRKSSDNEKRFQNE